MQNNKIQTLGAQNGGISQLVNLQKLNVANNRIRDVDEFEHIRKLIALRQLTFADEHFGSNPIVNHPDYRSFAITVLKQVQYVQRHYCNYHDSVRKFPQANVFAWYTLHVAFPAGRNSC